jgi:uncharacterized protein YbgA (DUF1722 family)
VSDSLDPLRIGISSRLLAQNARFDGGHVLGYFRDRLDGDSRAEVLARIEEYRSGVVPLIVPITLIRHHVRRLHVEYRQGQVYLDPHPKELALRNRV